MNFQDPKALLLLWSIPLVAAACFYEYRRLQRILWALGRVRVGELLSGRLSPLRVWIKSSLLVAATIALCLGLARPRLGFVWKDLPRGGRDIMLLVDLSSSMLATDFKPNRLERAKRELMDLVDSVNGDRIGVIVFAGSAYVQCPLTTDYRLLKFFLQDLDPLKMPVQGTLLTGALELALAKLGATSASDSQGKAMILVTDGEDQEEQPVAVAQKALAAGVKIFALGIGSVEGAPIALADGGFKKDAAGNMVVSRLGLETLKTLTETSHGFYALAHPQNDAELEKLYHQAQEQSGLLTEEQNMGRQKVWQEHFSYCLALAVFLLLLEFFVKAYQVPTGRKKIRKHMQSTVTAQPTQALDPEQTSIKAQQQPDTPPPMTRLSYLLLLAFTALLGLKAPNLEANPLGLSSTLKEAEEAYKKEDYTKASKNYLDAEVEQPQALKHAYNRALSQYQEQKIEEAEQGFAKAAQSQDPILAQQSLYNLGNTRVLKGDLEGALQAYEQALKHKPKDPETIANKEWVSKLLEKKQQEKQQQQDNKKQDSKNEKQDNKEEQKTQNGKEKEDNKDQKAEGNKQANNKEQPGKEGGKPEEQQQQQNPTPKPESKEQEGKEPKDSNTNKEKEPAGQAAKTANKSPEELSKEKALKLLKSLEDEEGNYGLQHPMPENATPPEKDW